MFFTKFGKEKHHIHSSLLNLNVILYNKPHVFTYFITNVLEEERRKVTFCKIYNSANNAGSDIFLKMYRIYKHLFSVV